MNKMINEEEVIINEVKSIIEESKKMVDSVNANGGTAKLTIYEGGGHNAWSETFQTEAVWKWLLTHTAHYQTTKSAYDNVENFG